MSHCYLHIVHCCIQYCSPSQQHGTCKLNLIWCAFTDCADVSITHLTFGKEYTQAIERKQVAQQEAEQHKFIVQKAEQERKVSQQLVLREVVRNEKQPMFLLSAPDLELSSMFFLMSTLTCRLPLSELRASPSRRNWFPTPQKSMVQPWSKFGGSRWLFESFCSDVSAALLLRCVCLAFPHNHRPRRISLPRWLVQETLRICHLATTCF